MICPNCGAQYEVPTEVIPESGRDVQCSDCGTTWFQHHPDHPPEDMDDLDPVDDAPVAHDAEAKEQDHAWQDETADYSADEEGEKDTAEDEESGSLLNVPDENSPTTDPKRREIDPSVADMLREEAEREARAREEEHRGTVETQQELGLQETDGDAQRRSEEARARMARLRGEPEAQKSNAQMDDIDPSSRSNLLPDIDEINSSLDSEGTKEDKRPASAEPDMTATPRKSSFRSGFRLAVILAVFALVVYIFAPQLSGAVPQLADTLSGYVDTVNSWRSSLNDLIQNVASSLSEEDAAGG